MVRSPSASFAIHRRLDARQAAVRARIVAAARAQVAEHGFEGIGMSAIARAAGVSRASMYRYFASKEHVVGAAAIDWGTDLAERLPAQLVAHRTLAETVSHVLGAIVDESESDTPMLRAILACLLAPGATGDAFRGSVKELFRALLSLGAGAQQGAHGEAPRVELELAFAILGRLLLANLALLAAGDLDARECRAQLSAYAEHCLRDTSP